jgi:hypothetical protein
LNPPYKYKEYEDEFVLLLELAGITEEELN